MTSRGWSRWWMHCDPASYVIQDAVSFIVKLNLLRFDTMIIFKGLDGWTNSMLNSL